MPFCHRRFHFDGLLHSSMPICNTGVVISPVPSSILGSPRRRRRLLRLTLAAVALVGVGIGIRELPESPGRQPDHFSDQPAQLLTREKPVKITRADRRAIDRTLEQFVQAGMGRQDLAAAYRLSTAALHAGQTLAQWRRGDIPVYPYSARPGSTEGWTLQFVEGNRAAIDVFLQPAKREQLGPVTLAVDVRMVGDRWLVEGLAPTAIFSKAGEKPRVFANTDLARGNPAIDPERHLDASWLFVPVAAILLLMLTIPAVVVARRRHR